MGIQYDIMDLIYSIWFIFKKKKTVARVIYFKTIEYATLNSEIFFFYKYNN